MKYLLSFYYGYNGMVVVDVPRIEPTDGYGYRDEDDILMQAAAKTGFNGFYYEEDVLNTFLEDRGYTWDDFENDDDVANEFDDYTAGMELEYIESMGMYFQAPGLEIRPVPPHYKVGVIKWNQNPLFEHYGGVRR